jgi:hypothetical protein
VTSGFTVEPEVINIWRVVRGLLIRPAMNFKIIEPIAKDAKLREP